MQTEIRMPDVLYKDFPPALPPAKEEAPPQKKRRFSPAMLLRALCLCMSLAVISLCIVRQAEKILAAGVAEYAGSMLLGLGTDVIGGSVCEITFGDAGINALAPVKDDTPKISLPSVHYIPLDSIKNEILLKERLKAESLDALYSVDIADIPDNAYPIIPSDYSTDSVLALKNDTAFDVDMDKIAKDASVLAPAAIGKEPLVLVVHTHGTESFAEGDVPYYNESINHPRSEDVSQNIVAVGKVLCDSLNENGIPTIHCETMHDKNSYIKAYERTAESIEYYLEKYPSIEYVFDVHRDSLIRSDLTKLKPVTLYGDEPCAQIMMIIGSNEKGAADYDWQSNLVLAEAIQQRLFENASGVARQLYLRGATYNQQYAKHGLLVEIGSCGNTLAEAKTAAKAFAKAVADVIKGEN